MKIILKARIFTRTILILSFVSLFNDISSEMLYPVLPFYLKSIGFSLIGIGILEGISDAITGLSKGYFGNWSDSIGRRLPFVRLGYLFSVISKPMMAVFTNSGWIFSARFLDRLGKGTRTAARDAMLSNETLSEHKGKVFGLHRGMDTLGATLGPLIALLYLKYFPEDYRSLFLWAVIPGFVGFLLLLFIKEKNQPVNPKKISFSFRSFFSYWGKSPFQYKYVMTGLLFFTLLRSSDMFLLLMAKNCGATESQVFILYIVYNLVFAISAYPAGFFADKFGKMRTLMIGLVLFSLACFIFSLKLSPEFLFLIFILFGLYAAMFESTIKAWISNIAPKENIASALGTFSGLISLVTVLSGVYTGLIWEYINPEICFVFSGIAAITVVLYFYIGKRKMIIL